MEREPQDQPVIIADSGRGRHFDGRKPLPGLQFAPVPPQPEVPMFPRDMRIAGFDDTLAQAIESELQRQEDHVELIASENYASPRVLEAQGSVLTNKYAADA